MPHHHPAVPRPPRARGLPCIRALVLLVLLAAADAAAGPSAAAEGADPAAGGQVDPEALLARMSTALAELEYEGTLVYLHGHELSALHIAHHIDAGKPQESLFALSGPMRAVARNPQRVTCVLPDARPISIERQPHSVATLHPGPFDFERLRPNYLVHTLGRSRVAGRDTQVVGIIPRDDLRYGYRFFIDERTGLPLKTDLMDSAATPVEQVMFTELSIIEDGPDDDRGRLAGRVLRGLGQGGSVPAPESPATVDTAPWRFSALPAGFEVVAAGPMTGAARIGTDPAVEQRWFMLSDGLSAVSVYIQPAVSGLTGDKQVGAVSAAGRVVDGAHVTVVGEVPAKTIERILEGLGKAG
jgi:sigma-E factor negative regulatory protein RseB